MAGKKGKKSGGGLKRGDAELWKAMTKDVRRLPGRDYEDPAALPEAVPASPKEIVRGSVLRPGKPVKRTAAGTDVDLRTLQKFTRGQMRIEATIDLHGMGQAQARESLERFIKSSYERERRCVLVVTGKGSLDKPGILKTKVPGWLGEGEVAGIVLKTAPAKAQHGGHGALYVLLRRKR